MKLAVFPQAMLAGTFLGLAVAGCSRSFPTPVDAPTSGFPVITPRVLDVPADRHFIGSIRDTNHVELRSRVRGHLEAVAVDEGQRVTRGQLLFSISRQEFETELRLARAKLKTAEANLRIEELGLENTRRLLDKRIIAQADFDLTQIKAEAAGAQVEEARAAVDGAERRLAWAEVRAPFDGVISRVEKRAGSMVQEGDRLTSISNDGDVHVYFNVGEGQDLDLLSRREGHPAGDLSLELAGGRPYPHRGRIEVRDTVVDSETGTVVFRGRFPNPERVLGHGASARVTVHDTLRHAVVIPQRCTFEVQHKLCVYQVDDQNQIRLCAIEPMLRLPRHFVIARGLDAQDRILLEGIQSVREGDTIAPEAREWSPGATF